MELTLHPYQQQALYSTARDTFAVAGIQGGKTIIGAAWLRLQESKYKDPDDCFIVAVPTYKTWAQATSFHFHKMFIDLGEMKKMESVFVLNNGRKIYIRSMDNVWSCEGITNCRGVWCDEVGQFKYQAWVNIQGRAAFRQAAIFGSTTPYALNWLFHDIYRPWTDGKLKDVNIVQWKSVDNPHFPPAEYARQKAMLDSRTFAMKYEGTFQKMAGLVYEDFDRNHNQCPAFDWMRLRERYYVYAGVDWGFSNPFAITVRLLSKNGQFDYQIDEFLRSYMDPADCVRIARDFKSQYGIECFFCDEEAPDYIRAFNNAGLKAIPVRKGKGSVLEGIGLHNTLIKTRVHKLFQGKCSQTIDEYETYQFKEKDSRYDNVDENPIDANNHLLSANRYVTMATQWIREAAAKKEVFKPQETRIQTLLKRRQSAQKSWEVL